MKISTVITLPLGSSPLVSRAETTSTYCPAKWIVGQPVNTTSGMVMGHSSAWKPLVSEYLGIRYALPPTGPRRWAPPEKFTGAALNGSTGGQQVIEASSFAPSCPKLDMPKENETITYESMQSAFIKGLRGTGDRFDEDCLALNVWTRPQSSGFKIEGDDKGDETKLKTVMVFIHGGSFTGGSSTWDIHNGARLADEHDVVVVSINYRLTVFGFPAAHFFEDANLGVLDQRLALEWVRDNIASFGGDPDRITLFGESAGATSAEAHAFAYPDDPIFRALILQSGFLVDIPHDLPDATLSLPWFLLSQTLGCGGADTPTEQSLACMREKPWRAIVQAIEAPRGDGSDDTNNAASAVVPFLGSLFLPRPDNRTVFADSLRRRKEGLFAKVPVLTGDTAYEQGLFQVIDLLTGRNTTAESDKLARDIRCGQSIVAGSRTLHDVPAWRFMYAAEGYANQDIGVPGGRGAWHGAELAMVFGTSELALRRADDGHGQGQGRLGWTMRRAWTGFAKEPWAGLARMGWPGAEHGAVVMLGGPASSEVWFQQSSVADKVCERLYM